MSRSPGNKSMMNLGQAEIIMPLIIIALTSISIAYNATIGNNTAFSNNITITHVVEKEISIDVFANTSIGIGFSDRLIKARLLLDNGSALSGQEIEFFTNDSHIGSNLTDVDGYAFYAANITGIEARFSGFGYFNPSLAMLAIPVNETTKNITIPEINTTAPESNATIPSNATMNETAANVTANVTLPEINALLTAERNGTHYIITTYGNLTANGQLVDSVVTALIRNSSEVAFTAVLPPEFSFTYNAKPGSYIIEFFALTDFGEVNKSYDIFLEEINATIPELNNTNMTEVNLTEVNLTNATTKSVPELNAYSVVQKSKSGYVITTTGNITLDGKIADTTVAVFILNESEDVVFNSVVGPVFAFNTSVKPGVYRIKLFAMTDFGEASREYDVFAGKPKTVKLRTVIRNLKRDYKLGDKIRVNINTYDEKDRSVVADTRAFLVDSEGNASEIGIANGVIDIDIGRAFRPGKYTIRLTTSYTTENGTVLTGEEESEFSLGLVNINTEKSIYLPGENASIVVGVLNSYGHRIPEAYVDVKVTSPSGSAEEFTTNDRVLGNGDGTYNLSYRPAELGIYHIYATAVWEDVNSSYETTFEVRENVAFDILRKSETVIYLDPPTKMKIEITPHANASSIIITEPIPTNFTIVSTNGVVIRNASGTFIVWNFAQISEKIGLQYTYDAPNQSPMLYLAGPLQITYNENGAVKNFGEIKPWSIAVDVAFYYYVKWTWRFRATNNITDTMAVCKGDYYNVTLQIVDAAYDSPSSSQIMRLQLMPEGMSTWQNLPYTSGGWVYWAGQTNDKTVAGEFDAALTCGNTVADACYFNNRTINITSSAVSKGYKLRVTSSVYPGAFREGTNVINVRVINCSRTDIVRDFRIYSPSGEDGKLMPGYEGFIAVPLTNYNVTDTFTGNVTVTLLDGETPLTWFFSDNNTKEFSLGPTPFMLNNETNGTILSLNNTALTKFVSHLDAKLYLATGTANLTVYYYNISTSPLNNSINVTINGNFLGWMPNATGDINLRNSYTFTGIPVSWLNSQTTTNITFTGDNTNITQTNLSLYFTDVPLYYLNEKILTWKFDVPDDATQKTTYKLKVEIKQHGGNIITYTKDFDFYEDDGGNVGPIIIFTSYPNRGTGDGGSRNYQRFSVCNYGDYNLTGPNAVNITVLPSGQAVGNAPILSEGPRTAWMNNTNVIWNLTNITTSTCFNATLEWRGPEEASADGQFYVEAVWVDQSGEAQAVSETNSFISANSAAAHSGSPYPVFNISSIGQQSGALINYSVKVGSATAGYVYAIDLLIPPGFNVSRSSFVGFTPDPGYPIGSIYEGWTVRWSGLGAFSTGYMNPTAAINANTTIASISVSTGSALEFAPGGKVWYQNLLGIGAVNKAEWWTTNKRTIDLIGPWLKIKRYYDNGSGMTAGFPSSAVCGNFTTSLQVFNKGNTPASNFNVSDNKKNITVSHGDLQFLTNIQLVTEFNNTMLMLPGSMMEIELNTTRVMVNATISKAEHRTYRNFTPYGTYANLTVYYYNLTRSARNNSINVTINGHLLGWMPNATGNINFWDSYTFTNLPTTWLNETMTNITFTGNNTNITQINLSYITSPVGSHITARNFSAVGVFANLTVYYYNTSATLSNNSINVTINDVLLGWLPNATGDASLLNSYTFTNVPIGLLNNHTMTNITFIGNNTNITQTNLTYAKDLLVWTSRFSSSVFIGAENATFGYDDIPFNTSGSYDGTNSYNYSINVTYRTNGTFEFQGTLYNDSFIFYHQRYQINVSCGASLAINSLTAPSTVDMDTLFDINATIQNNGPGSASNVYSWITWNQAGPVPNNTANYTVIGTLQIGGTDQAGYQINTTGLTPGATYEFMVHVNSTENWTDVNYAKNITVTPPSKIMALDDPRATVVSQGWGNTFNYSVNVTSNADYDINVTLWRSTTGSDPWYYMGSGNWSVDVGGLQVLNYSYRFTCDDGNNVTTWYFKFNATDEHGHTNESAQRFFTVQKDTLFIALIQGNDSKADTTGDAVAKLVVKINDTNGTDLNSRIFNISVTNDGAATWANFTNTTNSTGHLSIDFNATCSYSVGRQFWKASVQGDSCYNDISSTNYYLNITRDLNVTIFQPDGSTAVWGDNVFTYIRVLDNCSSSVDGAVVNTTLQNSTSISSFILPGIGGGVYQDYWNSYNATEGWYNIIANVTKAYFNGVSKLKLPPDTIYVKTPPRLKMANVTPTSNGWVNNFNFTINVTDEPGHNVTVRFYERKAGGSWNEVLPNQTCWPCEGIVLSWNKSYTCNDIGSWDFQFIGIDNLSENE